MPATCSQMSLEAKEYMRKGERQEQQVISSLWPKLCGAHFHFLVGLTFLREKEGSGKERVVG